MWVKGCLSLFQQRRTCAIWTRYSCNLEWNSTGTKKLSPLQHKPANCFSFVLQYLGSRSSVWPIILILFFGLCKEPNNKNGESVAAAAAAATHYSWPHTLENFHWLAAAASGSSGSSRRWFCLPTSQILSQTWKRKTKNFEEQNGLRSKQAITRSSNKK